MFFDFFSNIIKNIYCGSVDNSVCNGCSTVEPGDPCNSEYRFSIFQGSYVFCKDISTSSSIYYYLKNKLLESDGDCLFTNYCEDKIVFNTNECVPNCNGLNEVADFCYQDSDFNSISSNYELIGLKKYKCKEYTKILLIGEEKREFHICINDPQKKDSKGEPVPVTQKCDTLYYDFDEKKCVESCVNKKITIRTGTISTEEEFRYYECRNECESEENNIEYNESDDNEESADIYCLSECPSRTTFHYEKTIYQNSKCLKECDKNHFYDENNICSSTCSNVHYLKDNIKDSFFCDGNDCPISSHPYRYKKKIFVLDLVVKLVN